MPQGGDVPQGVRPFLREGVLEGRVGALLHQVAGEQRGGRAHQQVAIGVAAAQVEKGDGLAAEVHKHGLVLHNGVGDHQFGLGAFACRHFRFQGGDHAALPVPVLFNLACTVRVRIELRDTLVREDGVAEEVVVVGVGVHHHQRQLGLFAHGGQDFPALPGSAAGVDHHGALGADYESGIELRAFGGQHMVVLADLHPSRHSVLRIHAFRRS
ncbi:hypothetical protein D9M72_481500 [compost metagenome]